MNQRIKNTYRFFIPVRLQNLRAAVKAVIVTIMCCGWATNAGAQNLVIANPGEMTDFRSVFVNPAILVFQEPHAAIGGKMFHIGFVEDSSNPFRQGYVSLALPSGISEDMGLGLQAQYFNSPLYSQSNLSFVLSRRFRHIYAFGLRVNIFSKSYNQDQFDLVDIDDPVFRNGSTQWAGTFGAGVSMFPMPFLSLGIGVDHINRANISLSNDTVYQPLAGYVGAVLTVGMFQASVSGFYQDHRWLPKTTIATTVRKKGYAMLGFSQNAFQAEGQWRIAGPLSLNYNYEYTLFDNEAIGAGSHSMTLIHEFNHNRDLPKFELPDEFRAKFRAPDKSMDEEAKFYIYSIVDKLDITEKRLTRVISPDVTAEQLSQLTLHELGILDSSRTESMAPFDEEQVDLALIPATLEASLSKDYEKFIKGVSRNIEEKNVKTRVITPKESYLRAAGLRRHFVLDSLSSTNLEFLEPVYDTRADSLKANRKLGMRKVKPFETLTSLSVQTNLFRISPIANTLSPKDWRLVIRDGNAREVKSFEGAGMPISELHWDWRDTFGNLLSPGIYAYQLEWHDQDGQLNTTGKKYITVQKLLRNIKIEITNKLPGTGVEADEIDIILKK